MDELVAFARVISVLGGGGDVGAIFPASDVDDLGKGARLIPGEVTDARRAGQTVTFVRPDTADMSTWYWLMPDNTKIVHGVCS